MPQQPARHVANPAVTLGIPTRYTHVATGSDATMEDPEDTQDLSSQDADDDFERRMIQNARDERRLKEALHSSTRVQAFRKARAPRIGLTIDNLERNNARNHDALGHGAHPKLKSPPSSSGSARSDPAIHAPPAWGRKSRSNRNWMRTITYEEQLQTTPPPPADDTVNGLDDDQYMGDDGDPRRAVQDSPLSHKSTPRNDRSADWDLTFELNEASIIASTPYIPRNTMLDDIRQREVEGFKPDSTPESPLHETRRPRLVAMASSVDTIGPEPQGSTSPGKRLRTNSWKSIGKSQPVTGTGKENSPVTVYQTSTETVSIWEQDAQTSTRRVPSRPLRHRREDSQDLLRRLARVSNTPSPGRVEASRPQTAPASQLSNSSQTTADDAPPAPVQANNSPAEDPPVPELHLEPKAATPEAQSQQEETKEISVEAEAPPKAAPERETEDVDATPMPSERPILNPKTPVVTGAWVDTPGPRTIRKHISIARSPSQSPKKGSPRKNKSPEKVATIEAENVPQKAAEEPIRPQLPSSALHALVQEAKAHGRGQSADYGDSTINSLEDLISSPAEGENDEDTLQGLQLPTVIPRNDAERQRQQELQHLHRMNDRLRAARSSIRDASRGMKRVEDRVEHVDEVDGSAKVVLAECPCAVEGHQPSIWRKSKILLWDAKLKTKRQGTNWRTLGGLTTLGILLLVFFVWWISEEVACELYCHHPYANYSPYGFSVNPNAPQYPFVLPTLAYRTFFWWLPPGLALNSNMSGGRNAAAVQRSAGSTAAWTMETQIADQVVWDQSMLHDEVIR
jgi:hypothetical protein